MITEISMNQLSFILFYRLTYPSIFLVYTTTGYCIIGELYIYDHLYNLSLSLSPPPPPLSLSLIQHFLSS